MENLLGKLSWIIEMKQEDITFHNEACKSIVEYNLTCNILNKRLHWKKKHHQNTRFYVLKAQDTNSLWYMLCTSTSKTKQGVFFNSHLLSGVFDSEWRGRKMWKYDISHLCSGSINLFIIDIRITYAFWLIAAQIPSFSHFEGNAPFRGLEALASLASTMSCIWKYYYKV